MSTPPHWSTRKVSIPGRGDTFVRESDGPLSAPTLVLLHGLGATGLLNWRAVLDPLARTYHVVVVDHRGHGRGIDGSKFNVIKRASPKSFRGR